jgi:outer membrane cobalamin receptor
MQSHRPLDKPLEVPHILHARTLLALSVVVSVALSVAAPVASFAQSKLDTTQHIDAVVVRADRNHAAGEVIPAKRLSGKQLETLSSYSVADAVRYFSGVQIKDYGGIGGLKTVDLRSMGTNQMGVFYDGMQLGNAQNGQVDLGRFSLDNIEEIALYNGQRSEIFQSAKDFGSAGTIYLRSRRPRFVSGKTTNVKAYLRTGSFDLVNPSVLWEQQISGGDRSNDRSNDRSSHSVIHNAIHNAIHNISASLNAEYLYSSGKYKFRYRKVLADGTIAWDTTAVRQNGDIQAMRIEGSIYGSANGSNKSNSRDSSNGSNGSKGSSRGYFEQCKWYAKVYYYGSERGIPGAVVNNVWKQAQRQWDRNFFVQGSVEAQGRTSVQLNVKYANDYMRYLSADPAQMYIDNSFVQQEAYVSLANKYAIVPHWDVNLSTDYQWNALDADMRGFVRPVRNTALAALATAFEWQRLKVQASVLGTFVFDKTRNGSNASNASNASNVSNVSDKQEWSPAIFLAYQPLLEYGWTLRAFYKRVFRMPTFNDLYYTDIGNVALRPEYATQYNVGVHYDKTYGRMYDKTHERYAGGLLRSLRVSVEGYYNEVQGKIVAIPRGSGQYRWMMMNLGYVEIRGVDAAVQAAWLLPAGIGATTTVNYTYQRAQDFSDPASRWYGGQIAYIPHHSGSAVVGVDWRGWDVNYSFVYVGERYRTSANIAENHEQPWYTHDLALGKAFGYRWLRFKVSAEVNNMLNQYYDVVPNYPMPGRNYRVVVRVEG